MYTRENTRQIKVGNLTMGGENKVLIQSMTNTKTRNVEATVAQIRQLEDVGCQIIRVAVFNEEDALAVKEIKKQINIPLVCDIHFDYKLAITCIEMGA
ncbi:MAG: flavodoxin-dependent (E)-4-hydroxy-3-methylbut-2-enyl-diphosphate synthase, partial [Erysipelotrichaceae bacterium]|nr:flavodoxin-dependent (E)-4-hydroxy-3-methylbut-2-enyl-diphosphate synthase [Erysipelotrichaceae bacterium]